MQSLGEGCEIYDAGEPPATGTKESDKKSPTATFSPDCYCHGVGHGRLAVAAGCGSVRPVCVGCSSDTRDNPIIHIFRLMSSTSTAAKSACDGCCGPLCGVGATRQRRTCAVLFLAVIAAVAVAVGLGVGLAAAPAPASPITTRATVSVPLTLVRRAGGARIWWSGGLAGVRGCSLLPALR